MEKQSERLFRVLGDIGPDLIATAERKTFAPSPWRRILPVAASLILAAGLAMAAAPWFLVKEAAPAAPAPEPQVQEMPPMEETPAEQMEILTEAAEETPVEYADALWAQPKEKVTFWDTVYYVEAEYGEAEAKLFLGDDLGGVYEKVNTITRADHKERNIPMEIFVPTEKGYDYCLTYFQSVRPVMEWETVQYALENDQIGQLAESLILPVERARIGQSVDLEYGEGETLGPDQLVRFFLATLELERIGSLGKADGLRDREEDDFLWLQEDGTYVIPLADVQEQLEKYLNLETPDLEQAKAYDPVRNALVLTVLELPEPPKGIHLEVETAKPLENEGQGLYLQTRVFRGEEMIGRRTYVLDFTDGRVVYKAMETVAAE